MTSPNPGELVIAWDAPGNAPDDYRVTWKKSTGRWTSYKNANTVEGGNAFPTGTSHTVTGLEEGTAYKGTYKLYFQRMNEFSTWRPTSSANIAAVNVPVAYQNALLDFTPKIYARIGCVVRVKQSACAKDAQGPCRPRMPTTRSQ